MTFESIIQALPHVALWAGVLLAAGALALGYKRGAPAPEAAAWGRKSLSSSPRKLKFLSLGPNRLANRLAGPASTRNSL